jgi:hypothetical protein
MATIQVVNFILVLVDWFRVCGLALCKQLFIVFQLGFQWAHFQVQIGNITFMSTDMPTMRLQLCKELLDPCLKLFRSGLLDLRDLLMTSEDSLNF